MTKKELEALKVGTVVYNGHSEGIITMDGKIKGIQIFIPIYGLNDESRYIDDRADEWDILE